MFIGEAPGRLGAERTAIPFHGDVAGENFERLLSLAGLRRNEVFVTNSILCNPTDSKGNNAPPSRESIRNCSTLLAEQISVINPAIVVTLGAAALSAVGLIQPHDLTLSKDVRTARSWNGRKLIPLYHPGARALIHRNFATQTADYYFVGEAYRRMASTRPKGAMPPPPRAGWQVVQYVLAKAKVLSLFRLHKIMYLLDYKALEMGRERVTDFFYIRQKDGPYCVELGTKWYMKFEDLDVSFKSGSPILNWRDAGLFAKDIAISVHQRSVIDELLQSFTELNDAQLKTRAYLTRPMKRALRAERTGLVGLNRALL
jgi:uracil-DNA glycosylase family 4